MVSFSFEVGMAPMIQEGRKDRTIRRTRRCEPGDRMHLFTGLRTKQCKLLAVKKCVAVESVIIDPRGLIVGTAPALMLLDKPDSDVFAFKDGFLNYHAMREWFLNKYRQQNLAVFHGFVHRWEV